MENKRIKVLLIKTEGPAEVKYVKNELSELQKLVGGHIETVSFSASMIIVCDEEGLLKGKQPNPAYKSICGDFFICNTAGDEFTSLSDNDVRNLRLLFKR